MKRKIEVEVSRSFYRRFQPKLCGGCHQELEVGEHPCPRRRGSCTCCEDCVAACVGYPADPSALDRRETDEAAAVLVQEPTRLAELPQPEKGRKVAPLRAKKKPAPVHFAETVARHVDDFLNPSLPDAAVDQALNELGVEPAALAKRGLDFVNKVKKEGPAK